MEHPSWLKIKATSIEKQIYLEKMLRKTNLHTVCEDARCPNIGECFSHNTATFLILGNICTRNCGFCAIQKGFPGKVDFNEPDRLVDAVLALRLKYVVITSVTRDDLHDGGASVFAAAVNKIREATSGISIELLIPDFLGSKESLKIVVDSQPEVINHNIETVPRLYDSVRIRADYRRSLNLLFNVKKINESIKTKSGIMVGLGETDQEIFNTIKDLYEVGCDILTIGQYLAPTKKHAPVKRFVSPEHFKWIGDKAREIGFKYVASAPLVRSSYHAVDAYNKVDNN